MLTSLRYFNLVEVNGRDIVHSMINMAFPVYQPIIRASIKNGNCQSSVVGVEILARLRGIKKNYTPATFMKYFNCAKSLNKLTEVLINRSLLEFKGMHHRPGFVCINISTIQFTGGVRIIRLLSGYRRELSAMGISLTVELGEGYDIKNRNTLSDVVKTLVEDGIEIAIDDYGKYFSSDLRILLLKRVDKIKIDKAIIERLPGCKISEALVKHVFELARVTESTVIAEGVETQEQVRFITDVGISNRTLMQGYHFSRPISALALDDYINITKDHRVKFVHGLASVNEVII